MPQFKHLRAEQLPEDWSRRFFGDLVRFKIGKTPPRNQAAYWQEGRYPWVSIADMKPYGVVTKTSELVSERAHTDIFRRTLVPAGSLLMSFKLTIGRVAKLGMPSYHNEAIISFRPDEATIDEDFLLYYLSQINYRDYQDTAVKGMTLNSDKLQRLEIACPPLPEQRQIAAVLNLVRRAIGQHERLVAQTGELKSSLLGKLYSEGSRGEPQRGTDRGAIPESWRVMPLGECCTVQTGLAKGRRVEMSEALTVPYLRVANVQDGYLDLSEIKTITIRAQEKDRYLLRVDDVLLTEGGDLDKLGRGFIWQGEIEDCIHQNHVYAVRVNRELLLPRFLAHLLQSPHGKAYFLSVAHKTTNLATINTSKLRAFPVLLPSLEEQEEIVWALDTVDRRLSILRRKRDLLADLFRTLLHQLMTAQIRVADLDRSALIDPVEEEVAIPA